MRIYVAAASAELTRAERVRDALRDAGHEITVDWMSVIREAGVANAGLSEEKRRKCADDDFLGVATANRVVILVPVRPSVTQGAWWEGGIADALEIPIIASGRPEDRAKNIFLSRSIEVDTDDEAIALCREDDLLRRFKEQADELDHYRRRVLDIERGIASLAAKIRGSDLTDEETSRLYNGIMASVSAKKG